jgi:hypothetical protein
VRRQDAQRRADQGLAQIAVVVSHAPRSPCPHPLPADPNPLRHGLPPPSALRDRTRRSYRSDASVIGSYGDVKTPRLDTSTD